MSSAKSGSDVSEDEEETQSSTVAVSSKELEEIKKDNDLFRQSLTEMKKKIGKVVSTNEAIYAVLKKYIESQPTTSTAQRSVSTILQETPRPNKRRRKSVRVQSDSEGIIDSSESDEDESAPSNDTTPAAPQSVRVTRIATGGIKKVDYTDQTFIIDSATKSSKSKKSIDDQIAKYRHLLKGKTSKTGKPPQKFATDGQQDSFDELEDEVSFEKEDAIATWKDVEGISEKKSKPRKSKDESVVEKAAPTAKKQPPYSSNSLLSLKTIQQDETPNEGPSASKIADQDPSTSKTTNLQWKLVKGGALVKWEKGGVLALGNPISTYQQLLSDLMKLKGFRTLEEMWGNSVKPSKVYRRTFNTIVTKVATDMIKNVKTDGIVYIREKYKLDCDGRSFDDFITELPEPCFTSIQVGKQLFFDAAEDASQTTVAAYYEIVRGTVDQLKENIPTY